MLNKPGAEYDDGLGMKYLCLECCPTAESFLSYLKRLLTRKKAELQIINKHNEK